MLPGGPIGGESGGSTVVVGMRSLCDLVAERLTDVDRPRMLVLVHVGQLVYDDRQVGAIRRRHIDAVERGECAALIQLEDEAEHSALVDPDLVPPERVGPQHTLRGRAFGIAERRGVRDDMQNELGELWSANEVEEAADQRPGPRGATLGLCPDPAGKARDPTVDQRADRLGDEGHNSDQTVGDRLAESQQPPWEIPEQIEEPFAGIAKPGKDPAGGAAEGLADAAHSLADSAGNPLNGRPDCLGGTLEEVPNTVEESSLHRHQPPAGLGCRLFQQLADRGIPGGAL